ncbi:hypothetical protein HS960_26630 [Sphingobacterium paramultivorum]|uniref:Uncharacterized protein n=1 Tax=Sphingobacterium paramultivorum TaxID=2886510 RepID=A0A7G5EAH3_9SPHI|nr:MULTISPECIES: hypothetical protein [Sphingobacterium]MCS4164050.1 hypothetical protein [Sphingobacterium sp. BIGb0116]QMV70998.1 hypothetical protein HS960_26630 [Sphingobacterium paramultivorum]WSO14887.1 hypothetical protein VUL84_26625 [Sphingobacterium paramultivorum]
MRYFIAEPAGQVKNDLFFEVANFLWDSGNEVSLGENIICNCQKMQHADYDYTISLVPNNEAVESLFNTHYKIISKYFDKIDSDGPMLVLANTGIYTNALPYPHKIYSFEKLDRQALVSFFDWCKRFNLFVRKK